MAYLGKTPSQAVRQRYYFTASGGETSLSGADDNGNTLTFTDGAYVDVYLNGVLLVAGTDYNTSTANTIGGLTALSASDVVELVVYDTFAVFGGEVQGDFSVTNGNLGIGTSSPDAPITIQSANGDFGGTYNDFNGVSLFISNDGTGGDGTFSGAIAFDSPDRSTSKHAAIAPVQTGSDVNQVGLSFWVHPSTTRQTSLSEAMRLDSNGNLGIGGSLTPSFTNGGGLLVYNSTIPRVELRNSTTGTSTTDGAGIGIVSDDLYVYTRDTGSNIRFEVDGDERVRIDSSGLSFDDGANHLDDYDEGTWSAFFRGASTAGTFSYGTRVATYTKVGNLVTCFVALSGMSLSGGAGALYLSGLPFIATDFASSPSGGSAPLLRSFSWTGDYVSNHVRENTSRCEFWSVTNNGSYTQLNVSNFGSEIYMVFSYTTNS